MYYQQGGQQDQIMQIIQAYAQMSQMDPRQLMEQLKKMPAEKQQQAIQQMMQTLQQSSGQSQEPDMTQAAMEYGGYTTGMFADGGEMIRRANGSYSRRGMWDNIRENEGSGKKPTKEMLKQERKIRAQEMKDGGEKMPAEIARARFAAAGNLDQMSNYGYAYGGYVPEMMYGGYNYMAEGGEPNGGMALVQMSAVVDKMSKLRQFVSPDQNLDPWIASKLAVMDDSADAISDYMMYNPEAQENGEEEMMEQQGLPMEQMMRGGGYVVTRSSDRKGKTHKVTGPDGTVKYFGDSNLGQHPKDPERKKAFYARHKKNLAGNPYFRAFARKTWEEGGQIDDYMEQGGSTYSNGVWYEEGGELPMAQIGMFNPNVFNNLKNYITKQQQPQALQQQGTQLTGAANSNPYSWQNYSQSKAPTAPEQQSKNTGSIYNPNFNYAQFGQSQTTSANYDESTGMMDSPNGMITRNDTRQLGFSDNGLYVKDEAKNLQNTLDNGSAQDIRQGVKGFNQNFGTNLKTPGLVIGKKGRDTMQTIGGYSEAAKMGIGMASLATDLFINNPNAKRDNKQRLMNQGMTDALNMAAPEDRGDYVAAGSRIGELRPDQYVTNKGMYTGQFMPAMNMMQFGGTGIIEDENSLPPEMMYNPNRGMTASPEMNGPAPAENTLPANFKLTSNFEDYAIKADKYIRSVNPKTDVTGEMLAAAAQMAFEKTGKMVPVELALAQLQQEGYLAKGNKQNRPQRTKNPFNVGNTDNGSNIYHNDLQGGINSYYDLLTTKYLNKRSPEDLLENFVNGAGNRYASDKNYENSLKKIVSQVQNKVFEEGGVYDLSEDEIKSILSSGGNVEFI